jgi:hypothetical protein
VVEQWPEEPRVESSILSLGTTKKAQFAKNKKIMHNVHEFLPDFKRFFKNIYF